MEILAWIIIAGVIYFAVTWCIGHAAFRYAVQRELGARPRDEKREFFYKLTTGVHVGKEPEEKQGLGKE